VELKSSFSSQAPRQTFNTFIYTLSGYYWKLSVPGDMSNWVTPDHVLSQWWHHCKDTTAPIQSDSAGLHHTDRPRKNNSLHRILILLCAVCIHSSASQSFKHANTVNRIQLVLGKGGGLLQSSRRAWSQ